MFVVASGRGLLCSEGFLVKAQAANAEQFSAMITFLRVLITDATPAIGAFSDHISPARIPERVLDV
jgi:hypothetical protein